MADDLAQLQDRYAEFIKERDWEQFHTPQNVAMALSVEANELLECFLWHDNLPSDRIAENSELVAEVEEEIADVLIYSLSMAIQLDIDILEAVERKLDANEDRFDQHQAAEITERLEAWQRGT
jgi:NTP pyrophosphatase (non-canonical NTP hydrolase)